MKFNTEHFKTLPVEKDTKKNVSHMEEIKSVGVENLMIPPSRVRSARHAWENQRKMTSYGMTTSARERTCRTLWIVKNLDVVKTPMEKKCF